MLSRDEIFMKLALDQAHIAKSYGEVPVGAVIVCDNRVIAQGFNQPIADCDPSSHAEIIAIRQACTHLHNYRLTHCELFVTLEPCLMCTGALLQARIKRIIFGAGDSRNGALLSQIKVNELPSLNHRFIIESDVLATECRQLLQHFFKSRRKS